MGHFRIGLTGGIGSGKSTVAAVLQRHGAAIVDADVIARELTAAGGNAIDALRREFGPAAIDQDGALNRAWMRAQAFGDPAVRRRLEAIVHPHVRAETEHRAAALASSAPYVVLVIPLLIESGDWQSRVHRVLVIDCSEPVQRRAAAPLAWPLPTMCCSTKRRLTSSSSAPRSCTTSTSASPAQPLRLAACDIVE
jgi:dephospho-CoA kinase